MGPGAQLGSPVDHPGEAPGLFPTRSLFEKSRTPDDDQSFQHVFFSTFSTLRRFLSPPPLRRFLRHSARGRSGRLWPVVVHAGYRARAGGKPQRTFGSSSRGPAAAHPHLGPSPLEMSVPSTHPLPLDGTHRQGQVPALGPGPGTLEQHHQRGLALAGPGAQVARRGRRARPGGRTRTASTPESRSPAASAHPAPGCGTKTTRRRSMPRPAAATTPGSGRPTAAHQLPEHEAAASNASASVVAPWPGAPLTVTIVPRRREPPGKRGIRGGGTGRVRPATGVVGRTRAASPSGSCRDGREGAAAGLGGAAAGAGARRRDWGVPRQGRRVRRLGGKRTYVRTLARACALCSKG